MAVTASSTLTVSGGLWLVPGPDAAIIGLVGLLGLVGLSSNPVLVALAVQHGQEAPTLASAVATSAFNLGTAIGTGISGAALGSTLGVAGPSAVATAAAVLTMLLLGWLVQLEHRSTSEATAVSRPVGAVCACVALSPPVDLRCSDT